MSNNPTVVVASYLSSVTTIGHPKLALPSDPAWSRAVCAQHRGGDLCRWYCWPWDCMASGTAVEVIMRSSSVRKAVPSVSIWVFFLLPPRFDPFIQLNFEATPRTYLLPRLHTAWSWRGRYIPACSRYLLLTVLSLLSCCSLFQSRSSFSQLSTLPCLNDR